MRVLIRWPCHSGSVNEHAGHHSQGHSHGHSHNPGHNHDHGHGHKFVHSHDAADKIDSAMESSREGMRTLWLSLSILGLTAAAQAAVVALSGSVALLGDAVHNVADALTALPLGLAFVLGRRAPTRRYTY